MNPFPFAIGDKILVPRAYYSPVRATCPDCLGSKVWPITLPSGEGTSIQCPRCWQGGFQPSTGWVEEEYEHAAHVEERTVTGLTLNGDREMEVRTDAGYFKGHEVFHPDQYAQALQVAQEKAAVQARSLADDARRRWLHRSRKGKASPIGSGEVDGDHDTIGTNAHYNRQRIRKALQEAATAAGYKQGPMTADQLRAELEKAILKVGLP